MITWLKLYQCFDETLQGYINLPAVESDDVLTEVNFVAELIVVCMIIVLWSKVDCAMVGVDISDVEICA